MFDIGYVFRSVELFWRFGGRKRNEDILSETILQGRCWLNDLDTNWHMNNSRYLRECDFGRSALFLEKGFYDVFSKRRKNEKKNLSAVVSAVQAQFRQSIQLGDRFHIKTRIDGWDDKAFYIEQSIVLDQTGQTAFLSLVRVALTSRSITPQMLIDDLQIGSIRSPQLSSSMQIFKDNHRLKLQSKL